jgi:hypothetical protein
MEVRSTDIISCSSLGKCKKRECILKKGKKKPIITMEYFFYDKPMSSLYTIIKCEGFK